MIQLWLLGLLWVAGCVGPPVLVDARPMETGVEVHATGPVDSVTVWDDQGSMVLRQPLPAPADRAFLAVPLEQGRRYRVTAGGSEDWLTVPVRGPVLVEIEAPVGQGRQPVVDGARIAVHGVGEAPIPVALVLTAREPCAAALSWTDGSASGERTVALGSSGDRRQEVLELGADPLGIDLQVCGHRIGVELVPVRQRPEEARASLVVHALRMPTDPYGATDRARPPDRVTLPSAWWRRLIRRTGLGYRARDDQAPWTWQSLVVENRAELAVNAVIRSTVVDDDGEPVPAFLPVLRESVGDSVQVLVRLPPNEPVQVALPLFVRGVELTENGRFTRRVEVLPLGASEPLQVVERPLYVSRGSRWASSWLVAALGASGAGWLWLLIGARRWIATSPTADLVTIALFGSVTWVAGTALQVAGLGVSAVLGPFAPLLTGIADDALRACLLGTVVVLVPRPGTAALATAVGFVMRGLTMGTFHPVDLLYLGSAVFWLEAWLWLAGCTRGTAWRETGSVWLRLCVGLGFSNVCATATALVVSVVFYRLYFAGWYVALVLALPGFAYVCAGCWLAVGFSRSLRRVEG